MAQQQPQQPQQQVVYYTAQPHPGYGHQPVYVHQYPPPPPSPHQQRGYGYGQPYPMQQPVNGQPQYPAQPYPAHQQQQQQGYGQQRRPPPPHVTVLMIPKRSRTSTEIDDQQPPVDQSGSDPFSDKAVRRGFIHKVFTILSIQFLLNALIMAAFMFIEPVKQYVLTNVWLLYLSSVVSLGILIGLLCCCPEQMVIVPNNYILLFLFTLFEGICLGVISAHYKVEHVLIAMSITTVVTVGLSIFALQTKIDFTVYSGALFVFLIVLIVFGILLAILGTSRILAIVYSSLGALLFSAYLVVDVQSMTSGKRETMSPEYYILAALTIYIDIVNLFINLLQLVSLMDS